MALPPVRQRVPPEAYFFRPETHLSTNRAFFDLVKLRFHRYRVRYNRWNLLEGYTYLLGGTALFRRNSRNNDIYLHVQSGWLFGGSLRFRRGSSSEPTFANVTIELLLNPTRFLAHRRVSLDELNEAAPEIILRENSEAGARLPRTTLDQADNLLPDGVTRTYGRALDFFQLYVAKVTTLIDTTLIGQADNGMPVPDVEVLPNWSGFLVPCAEIYWEYSSPNALELVHRLHPHVTAAASQACTSVYPLQEREPEVTHPIHSHVVRNAISSRISLGNRHVELQVYAKTRDRVRFEVRFKRLRRALGPQAATQLIGDAITDLPRVLSVAVDAARNRLQRVRCALSDFELRFDPSMAELLRFARGLAIATGDNEALAIEIFSSLATTGGISSSDNPDFLQAIAALEQMEIIVRRRTTLRSDGARYTLAPTYASTVRALSRALSE